MSVRITKKNLKLTGVAGAALAMIAATAGPALAAPTTVTFNCDPLTSLPITMDAGTLPTSMVAGQKIKQPFASGVVHLDAPSVGLAESQGWTSVSGSATGDGSDGGTVYTLNIAQTAIPATPQPLDLPASGQLTLAPKQAGTYKVFAGATVAFIQGFNASGPANSITLPCAPPTDGSNQLGTIAVSKDKSKTTTKANYSAATDKATGKAKVKGAKFGLPGTGKVKFSLKKGTHTLKKTTGKLNAKGVAKAAFTHVSKPGKYTIVAKFAGNGGLKSSSGKASFTVK